MGWFTWKLAYWVTTWNITDVLFCPVKAPPLALPMQIWAEAVHVLPLIVPLPVMPDSDDAAGVEPAFVVSPVFAEELPPDAPPLDPVDDVFDPALTLELEPVDGLVGPEVMPPPEPVDTPPDPVAAVELELVGVLEDAVAGGVLAEELLSAAEAPPPPDVLADSTSIG